jgi:hypothetical protein
MSHRLRKFKVHGAYKRKADARRKERSAACGGRCFILPRVIKGMKRFIVLEKR